MTTRFLVTWTDHLRSFGPLPRYSLIRTKRYCKLFLQKLSILKKDELKTILSTSKSALQNPYVAQSSLSSHESYRRLR